MAPPACNSQGLTVRKLRAMADLIAGPGFDKIDFGGKAKEIKRAIGHLRGEG